MKCIFTVIALFFVLAHTHAQCEVVLVDNGNNTLEGFVTGDMGEYFYSYPTAQVGQTGPYTNYGPGCYTVTATNLVDCDTQHTGYYSPYPLGMIGDPDNCVDTNDLLTLLLTYGITYDVVNEGYSATAADFDCNGIVNASDLNTLLSEFGTCY